MRVKETFLQCLLVAIGGGPAEAGANTMRWVSELHEAFYNGWKSLNGLKHQTV